MVGCVGFYNVLHGAINHCFLLTMPVPRVTTQWAREGIVLGLEPLVGTSQMKSAQATITLDATFNNAFMFGVDFCEF